MGVASFHCSDPPSNLWEKRTWYSHYVEILIWETPRTYLICPYKYIYIRENKALW